MLPLFTRHTGRIGPAPDPHVLHWYRRVNLVANYSRENPRSIAFVNAWSGLSCDNSHTITPPAFSAASRAFVSFVAGLLWVIERHPVHRSPMTSDLVAFRPCAAASA